MSADHVHELCTDQHPATVFPYPHCGYCGDRMDRDAMPQVWCDKCDQPSTVAVPLTNGETAFRCSQHAWLLIAPKGAHV